MRNQRQAQTFERTHQRYRGFTLVARTDSSGSIGKAWCEGREIGTADGPCEADVMTSLRSLVDGAITIETAPGNVAYPDAAAYEIALRRNLERFNRKQIVLLCAHYAAPRHTASGEALASTAGCRTWTTVYSQYVLVGHMLAESMMFEPAAHKRGSPQWIRMVFDADGENFRNRESPWTLRGELTAALPASGILSALQVV